LVDGLEHGRLSTSFGEQASQDSPEKEERDDDGDREEAEQDRVLGRGLARLVIARGHRIQKGDSTLRWVGANDKLSLSARRHVTRADSHLDRDNYGIACEKA
jgi:hypothetical protein